VKFPTDPTQNHTGLRPSPEAGQGDVCWLECGARSMADALSEVTALVAAMGGDMTVLEREPSYMIVKADVAPGASGHLKGALALAGASVKQPEANAASEGVLIFILSSARAPQASEP
jgi:hypothetical protein